MRDERMSEVDSMEERLTRALERKPKVDVPAGFAARVAGQVPVRRAFAVPAARYGLLAARIGMGVLLLALVVVAMRFPGRTMFGWRWSGYCARSWLDWRYGWAGCGSRCGAS